MNYPMRILQVVVNMNRGGAETLIMNIYRNIDRSKVQFDFLVHKENIGAFEEEIVRLGGKIFRIPYVTDIGHLRYKRELNNFFKEHADYKAVHAHMDRMSGLVLEASKKAGIPIRISHSHNTQSEGNLIARTYKQYIGMRIIKNATHLLACSETAAKWLFRGSASNASIIKNGVEPHKFTYNAEVRSGKRTELAINSDTFIIGHVGRFFHQKNHAFLIDIFSEIKKKKPDTKLLLVGDGPLQSDIRMKAKQLKLDESVVFLGTRNDVAELMQVMDVMLFPSHHEGLPLTIIEAQASGLKCVVSEAIPRNADIGAKLISFLSLEEGIDNWVNAVTGNYKRPDDVETYLVQSGFDITYTAKDIQKFYLNSIVE